MFIKYTIRIKTHDLNPGSLTAKSEESNLLGMEINALNLFNLEKLESNSQNCC